MNDDNPSNDGEPTIEHTNSPLSRRALLGASAAATISLAGCLSDEADEADDGGTTDDDAADDGGPEETQSFDELPVVEDPPDKVYKPTHREPFVHLEMVEAGEYMLLPHFTYPHQFWLMSGAEAVEERPTVEDSMHLMVAFWDSETGAILPVDAGAEMVITQDGEQVGEPVAPWPMLAQEMGFHFGDNVAVPDDGTYTVELTMNPIGVRKTGAFEGRFEETVNATFELEYSDQQRQELLANTEFLDEDEWGEPGALEPTDHGDHDHDEHESGDHGGHGDDSHEHGDDDSHEHSDEDGHEHGNDDGHGSHDIPSPSLPPAEEYPGQDLGTHTSGDAAFVVRYLEGTRLADEGENYLLVSPRTPHNRFPLPDMSLSVDGDVEAELVQTLDSDQGHHYGASVTLEPGDEFDLIVESPPQVARHQGYETAFIEMPPMTVEVPDE